MLFRSPAATMAAQAAGGCRAAAVPASPSGCPRPREGRQPRFAGRITGQHVHAYPARRQCRQGGIDRGDEFLAPALALRRDAEVEFHPVHRGGERQRRARRVALQRIARSEEHTSELQSLLRISYAVFGVKKKKKKDK